MSPILTNPKTILVIEDDNALLGAITAKLDKTNFTVISARSVDEVFTKDFFPEESTAIISPLSITSVLDHLQNLTKIDAIWLDHNLIGGDDGLDFIVKFKANGGTWSTIPIFVVSNSANPDLIKTYAEIGINHYYLKAEHRLEDIVSDIVTALETETAVQ
jgi:CheY-like chemotaxis protein